LKFSDSVSATTLRVGPTVMSAAIPEATDTLCLLQCYPGTTYGGLHEV
jgi:hypothetical protein